MLGLGVEEVINAGREEFVRERRPWPGDVLTLVVILMVASELEVGGQFMVGVAEFVAIT